MERKMKNFSYEVRPHRHTGNAKPDHSAGKGSVSGKGRKRR